MQSILYSCSILMKLELSGRIFEKCLNVEFCENPSSRSRVVPCGHTDGRTDLTKLIIAFRNFTKAPKIIGSKLALTSHTNTQHDTRTRSVLNRTTETFALL